MKDIGRKEEEFSKLWNRPVRSLRLAKNIKETLAYLWWVFPEENTDIEGENDANKENDSLEEWYSDEGDSEEEVEVN